MAITALLALLLFSMPGHTQESRLPSIGGSGGGLIAGQQESDIGQQVMVSIRRSAPRISDPLVYDYLSAITYRLVPSAPLQNRDLTLFIGFAQGLTLAQTIRRRRSRRWWRTLAADVAATPRTEGGEQTETTRMFF